MGGNCFSVKKEKVIHLNKATIVKNDDTPRLDIYKGCIKYNIKVIRENNLNNSSNTNLRERSLSSHCELNSNKIYKYDDSIINIAKNRNVDILGDNSININKSYNKNCFYKKNSFNSKNAHSLSSSKRSSSKPLNFNLENFMELSLIIEHKRKASKRKSKFLQDKDVSN